MRRALVAAIPAQVSWKWYIYIHISQKSRLGQSIWCDYNLIFRWGKTRFFRFSHKKEEIALMGLWNLHILAQLHNGVFINRRRIVLGSVEAEDMTRVLVHWHMNRHIATIIRHSVSMLMTHDMDDTGAYLVSNHSKKKRSQNGTIIVGKNRLMWILNLKIYI